MTHQITEVEQCWVWPHSDAGDCFDNKVEAVIQEGGKPDGAVSASFFLKNGATGPPLRREDALCYGVREGRACKKEGAKSTLLWELGVPRPAAVWGIQVAKPAGSAARAR